MMTFVKDMPVVDAKTFRIVLTSPTGLVLSGLGKPSSNDAVHDAQARRRHRVPTSRSPTSPARGPFVFKKDEWKPGDKAVYVKFDKYKPRAEPPSGLAGGKVVKVDRVEWLAIADQQTAINALLAGEIDYIEQPAHDLLPLAEQGPEHQAGRHAIRSATSTRSASTRRPSRSTTRRSARRCSTRSTRRTSSRRRSAIQQYYKVCKALFICGTPLASTKGMDGLLESNFAKSKALLKEAGYDGTPIVLLHSTDLQVLTNLAPVAKSLLESGGFKVDMQSMDWQSVVARRAKKDPPAQGGWHAMLTSWVSADILNPVIDGVPQRELRQGAVRLAVRRRDGKAARRLRARDRSGEAEGDRRGGAGALDAVSDARASSASGTSRRRCARTSTASSSRRCRCSGTSTKYRRASDVARASCRHRDRRRQVRRPRAMLALHRQAPARDDPGDGDRRGARVRDAAAARRAIRRRSSPAPPATTQDVAAIRAKLGLDQPIVAQFFIWLGACRCPATSANRSSSRSRWPS